VLVSLVFVPVMRSRSLSSFMIGKNMENGRWLVAAFFQLPLHRNSTPLSNYGRAPEKW
jgi:hypothetical protein